MVVPEAATAGQTAGKGVGSIGISDISVAGFSAGRSTLPQRQVHRDPSSGAAEPGRCCSHGWPRVLQLSPCEVLLIVDLALGAHAGLPLTRTNEDSRAVKTRLDVVWMSWIAFRRL